MNFPLAKLWIKLMTFQDLKKSIFKRWTMFNQLGHGMNQSDWVLNLWPTQTLRQIYLIYRTFSFNWRKQSTTCQDFKKPTFDNGTIIHWCCMDLATSRAFRKPFFDLQCIFIQLINYVHWMNYITQSFPFYLTDQLKQDFFFLSISKWLDIILIFDLLCSNFQQV
jgi:hypothetical protein